jgi:cytochrome c
MYKINADECFFGPATRWPCRKGYSMNTRHLTFGALWIWQALAPVAAQDVKAGKVVAQTICAECHVIDSEATRPGNSAPGFAAIARMPSMTPLSLKVFLQSPHPTMPSVHLTPRELDDVVAYIMGLNEKT